MRFQFLMCTIYTNNVIFFLIFATFVDSFIHSVFLSRFIFFSCDLASVYCEFCLSVAWRRRARSLYSLFLNISFYLPSLCEHHTLAPFDGLTHFTSAHRKFAGHSFFLCVRPLMSRRSTNELGVSLPLWLGVSVAFYIVNCFRLMIKKQKQTKSFKTMNKCEQCTRPNGCLAKEPKPNHFHLYHKDIRRETKKNNNNN